MRRAWGWWKHRPHLLLGTLTSYAAPMLKHLFDLTLTGASLAFTASLLTYCIKNGVVGGGISNTYDVFRNEHPFFYWIGIAGLGVAVLFTASAFAMFLIVAIAG